MLYRILGPLEVARDAEPLPLAPRQRVVLSMLLLEPNRVVTVDRLVDAVWDAAPPPTAKEQIRICVSSIRRRLSAGGMPNTILTRPPGYFIQCTEENLDLLAFEALVSSSRAEAARHRHVEAVSAFRRALALWRGKPLSGMNSQLIESISTALDGRRLAVVEEYVTTQLRIGHPREPEYEHELISELTELVAANPFRERLRAQLMIALYQAGRRAEALETYRAGRQLFVAKLGLEPSDELVRTEQAILRGDPDIMFGPVANVAAAPVVPTVPRLLPPDLGDFVGRTGLVARLRQVLTGPRADAHTVRLATVHGRPWLGKTSLVVHVAHLVSGEFPDGQLFVNLGGSGVALAPGEVLRRFLGALGVAGSAIPDSTDERVEMYRNLVGDRRMLVVLDDAASERQVLPLLPGNPRCAVVVTSRVMPTNLPGATLVRVGSMSLPNSVELLTKVLGPARVRAQSAELTRLAELCAGEPLVLRLAAARLAARPHWPVARLVGRLSEEGRQLTELSHDGLDLTVTIRQTYDRLGGQAQRLLRRVSLQSTAAGFAGWACGPMLAATEDDADDALAELVNAGLLDVERDADGQVRFHLRGMLRTFARERLAEDAHV